MSTPSDTPDAAAREAWELMWSLWQQHGRVLQVSREVDLTPPQMFTLRHLRDQDGAVAMGDVAQRLHCDTSNVTGIVDRLEQRGLVERRGAEHDRRVKHLVLTDAGRAEADEIENRLFDPPAPLLALPQADQRTLAAILRRALDRA